ncbi:phosphoribosylformylglycinamidine synthase II, partial [Clostridium perfringens]|nr:phosphoribosylformylglycinamidine synthase II [Clostridium perfringens]
VSLYNENAKGAIYPTPVVGMIGLVHDTDHITTQGFKQADDIVLLLGETKAELGGSEFQTVVHGVTEGRPPVLDLAAEENLPRAVLAAIQAGNVQSAHDLSEGGLAGAFAVSCISGSIGASAELTAEGLRADIALFSESQSRILLSVRPEHADEVLQVCAQYEVPVQRLGVVGGDRIQLGVNGQAAIDITREAVERVWKDAIQCLMR